MKFYDEEEITVMIKDCNDRESRLSDWERGFISSINDKVDKGRTLSDRQQEMLNNIWERIT